MACQCHGQAGISAVRREAAFLELERATRHRVGTRLMSGHRNEVRWGGRGQTNNTEQGAEREVEQKEPLPASSPGRAGARAFVC